MILSGKIKEACMAKYLGSNVVDPATIDRFKDFTKSDWAMWFIEHYGQIDGDHHKNWVIDQVARILRGTPVIVSLSKWDDGIEEYTVVTSEEVSEDYLTWRKAQLGEYDEEADEYEYGYDEGIAP